MTECEQEGFELNVCSCVRMQDWISSEGVGSSGGYSFVEREYQD